MGIRMFDIGLNLTSSQFAKDRDEVVARAFAAGVKGLLLTGTNLHESEQAQLLAAARSALNTQKAESERLKAEFDRQEAELAEQEKGFAGYSTDPVRIATPCVQHDMRTLTGAFVRKVYQDIFQFERTDF